MMLTYNWLPNGLIRVYDQGSQLAGCWNADGTVRHGDLTYGRQAASIGAAVKRMSEWRRLKRQRDRYALTEYHPAAVLERDAWNALPGSDRRALA